MKKFFPLLGLLVLSILQAFSQPHAPLKKVLTLDPASYEAGNGAGVVWHPLLKRYYTARAGNVDYPLDMFDANGKKLSPEGQKTGFDMRGLWYDPMRKRICFNGYNESGWGCYKLDARGLPATVKSIVKGLNQPAENSVGAFHAAKSLVYFLNGVGVFAYRAQTGAKVQDEEILNLAAGIGKAYGLELELDSELPEFYNPVMVFTGRPNEELGLLNHEDAKIDLFSLQTGLRTRVLSLPEGTKVGEWFNLAFANGTFFLYDKEAGVWNGYR